MGLDTGFIGVCPAESSLSLAAAAVVSGDVAVAELGSTVVLGSLCFVLSASVDLTKLVEMGRLGSLLLLGTGFGDCRTVRAISLYLAASLSAFAKTVGIRTGEVPRLDTALGKRKGEA